MKKMIELDIKHGYTPDISELRYCGTRGLKIFLWDDLKDFNILQSLTTFNTILSEHYQSEYYLANTVDKVKAYYNLKAPYAGVIFDADADHPELDDYMKTEPRSILGKIVTVSLQLLTELDCYYENGGLSSCFRRKKIKVYPSPYKKTPVEAWTWFSPIDSVIESKEFDITPMRTETRNGVEYFEM